MKIAHISDIHIRNLKYHADYKRVFEDLYRKFDEIKPDIIINTGDTAHTKTQISPEFVEMCSEHMRRASEYAPYHVILGNHDMNLMNLDRQDALTPIVESIGSPRIFLHKKSGLVWSHEYDIGKVNLWTFSLADQDNYPLPSNWAKYNNDINIGLFHGSVRDCKTDSNWRMTNTEHDLDIFDGLDYALLGDIHKQQFFHNRKIAYAGSLIQQNFGEDINKGFLVWDIHGKNSHSIQSVILNGSRKFYTIRLDENLQIPDMQIEEGSRVRISPPKQLTLVQQKEIEKSIRRLYKPHDVVILSATNIGIQSANVGKKLVDFDNIRQLAVQERLIRNFFNKSLDKRILDKIVELNAKHQICIEQSDELTRNVTWKINKIAWSNLFNYGENNVIDFSTISGLTGIFAPNASGKSNFVDVILESCFDNTTKGISKNVFLINDKKNIASAIVELTANDQNYLIERTIERIKYGSNKSEHTKEWGKTTCNFYMVDEFGSREPLIGTLRPETERNIRQKLGTFDDFMLTSLSAQWNTLDIIACKETDRKKILYRFLDLDIFEQKCLLAKDESKEYVKRLRELEDCGLDEHHENYKKQIDERKNNIDDIKLKMEDKRLYLKLIEDDILLLTLQKKTVDVDLDVSVDSAMTKIKNADSNITALNNKIHELNNKLVEITSELSKLEVLEQKFDVEFHEKKANEYLVVDNELSSTRYTIAKNKQIADAHRKSIMLLQDVPCGNQYPQCKFLIDAFDSKLKLPLFDNNIGELENACLLLETKKSEISKLKDKLDLYRKFISEKESLISSRNNINLQVDNNVLRVNSFNVEKDSALADIKNYERSSDDIKRNNEISCILTKYGASKILLESELKALQDESMELTRLLGADQGVLERIDSQLSQLNDIRDNCSAYENYIKAMGKDGIAYQILTQKLPLVNDEINKILANAVDFSVLIEHDTEEQSIRLYLQYEDGNRRILELGGGAEKMLASIAIRSALLNISNVPKTNMFIIDEGFGKLDPKNIESINRMFDYLRSVYEHVIIISHIDAMKDIVDNTIEITSDEDGYAHIDIGG